VVYARNSELHFVPASNTKLVVTTVALGLLGPEWRYRTPLWVRLLPGDTTAAELRIAGTGDPTFSTRFWPRPQGAAPALASTIAAAGLRHIQLLVVDASRFTDPAVNGTWEVGDLPGTSAPPTGAFALQEGVFQLELKGGALAGEPAAAKPLFPLAAPNVGGPQPVRAVIVTDTPRARRRFSTEFTVRRDTVFLAGVVAAGQVDTLTLAQTNAPATAARALSHALAAQGVRVDSVLVVRTPGAAGDTAGMRRIGTLESPPLADIVTAILQPSQNWMAEQLLKTLGAETGGGGSWADGLAVERKYLRERAGVDSLAFDLRDASGLSAQNLLTPTAIVALLDHARAAPWGERYRSALAAPGVPGTLASRLPALRDRLQGKTGTITHVNSLSGFLLTDGGRELTFSILSNGSGVPAGLVRAAIDSTVTLLAREVR
jgi:D-alanyl-D-alanine carboxypeptidase/D-alanyl-D-alanine-endopeptidase (penicillin-binding protein 4)